MARQLTRTGAFVALTLAAFCLFVAYSYFYDAYGAAARSSSSGSGSIGSSSGPNGPGGSMAMDGRWGRFAGGADVMGMRTWHGAGGMPAGATWTPEETRVVREPDTNLPMVDYFPRAAAISADAAFPRNSKVYRFEEDPHGYSVCRLVNVCVSSSSWMFMFRDEHVRSYYRDRLQHGCTKDPSRPRPSVCNCLPFPWVQPRVISPEQFAQLPLYRGRTWLSDKLVGTHQIGHWAMKLVSMHSILQHADDYGLHRPITRFAFLRSDLALQPHEAALFDIVRGALAAPQPTFESTLWRFDIDQSLAIANLTDPNDEHARRKISADSGYKRGDADQKAKALQTLSADNATLTGGVCFEHATHSKLMEVYATSLDDASAFRNKAYEYYGLPAVTSCPPAKVVYLYRTEPKRRRRQILNLNVLLEFLAEAGIRSHNLEQATVGRGNSSLEQAALFSSFGLMFTAHSSQLANLIFARPAAAVIEVKPFFFNAVFMTLGRTFGLHYDVALGGSLQSGVEMSAGARACNYDLYVAGSCSKEKVWTPWINEDFYADTASFRRQVVRAVKHLDGLCGGYPGAWQDQAAGSGHTAG